MANFWGGWTPPRHSGTWVGARVASLRCHYPPPRRSQYSRNAKARPHKSKTSCRGGHRRGTTTSGPGHGPLAGFKVTLYGRFWGDRRGRCRKLTLRLAGRLLPRLRMADHAWRALSARLAAIPAGQEPRRTDPRRCLDVCDGTAIRRVGRNDRNTVKRRQSDHGGEGRTSNCCRLTEVMGTTNPSGRSGVAKVKNAGRGNRGLH